MKNKFKKFSTIAMALAMVTPVVAPVGSVLAAPDEYTRRNARGEVPILEKLDGTDIPFGRPVYKNNTDQAQLRTDLFKTVNNDGYSNPFKNDYTRDKFLTGHSRFGAVIADFNNDNRRYKHPRLQLIYAYPNVTKYYKNKDYTKYFPYYYVMNNLETKNYDFSKVKGGLLEYQEFRNDVQNYNIDFNKDGQLDLQYFYSVKVNANDFRKLLPDIKAYGLGFNAYVRVPDGYSAGNVIKAGITRANDTSRFSRLFLNPRESTAKWDDGLYFGRSPQSGVFSVFPSKTGSINRPLEKIDDHTLKFSMSSSTNPDYYSAIDRFIKNPIDKDPEKTGNGEQQTRLLRIIQADLPIQLQMLLRMNDMTEDGDQFDPTGGSLTKQRKLPAPDRRTTINATFLSSDKLAKVQLSEKEFGYFPFTNSIWPESGNTIPKDLNKNGYGDKKNETIFIPDNYLTGVNGVLGFKDNAHILFNNQDVLSNESTITKDGTDYDYSKEFVPEYNPVFIKNQKGNTINTWNQYISLYDTENDENNTEDSIDGPVYLYDSAGKQIKKMTKSLPYEINPVTNEKDVLSRKVTLHQEDISNNTFDPFRFLRTVNYFTKKDTTDESKGEANDKDQVKNKKNTVGVVITNADGSGIPKLNNKPVKILPGETKLLHYYGTDEEGIPFSPATLKVTRSKFDINGTTKVGFKNTSGTVDKWQDSISVTPDTTVTEQNKFTFRSGDADVLGKNIRVKVTLPDNAKWATTMSGDQPLTPDDPGYYRVRIKGSNGYLNKDLYSVFRSGNTATITLEDDPKFIMNDGNQVSVEYDYKAGGDVAVNTKPNTATMAATDDGTEVTGTVTKPAKIRILSGDEKVTFVSAPFNINFGAQNFLVDDKFGQNHYTNPKYIYNRNYQDIYGPVFDTDPAHKGFGIKYTSSSTNPAPKDWSVSVRMNPPTPGELMLSDIGSLGIMLDPFSSNTNFNTYKKITTDPVELFNGNDVDELPRNETKYFFPDVTFEFIGYDGQKIKSGTYLAPFKWNFTSSAVY